ncbi:MAG TPA: hypothetical protein DDY68_00620, partial [Porphyromonadaceae bacterium]|nr:hypothetical protein [Porphyromonadaceae bacterium]
MKSFLFSLLFLFCIVYRVVAQRDVVLNHYWAMPSIYNPAVAGSTDYLEGGLSGRWQHAGSTDAPIMVVATAHMPLEFLERRHGVGAVISYENVGKNHFVQMGVQYAFQMKLGKGRLHLSLQPTILNWKFNGSSYKNGDSTSTFIPYPFEENNITKEQIPTTDVNDNKLDLSLGAMYFYKNWHFGISCTHITKPTFQFSDTCKISCYPNLYCTIGSILKYNMYSL